jgi:hypothetical protein
MKFSRIARISSHVIFGITAFSIFLLGTLSAQSPQTPPGLSAEELQTYSKAHTVIDWTAKEIRSRKELKELEPAGSQQELTTILQETGKRVAAFFMSFPNLMATESIEWTTDHETKQTSAMGDFHYYLVRGPTLGGENLQEYRTDPKGGAIDYNNLQDAPLLTSRFTASLLYFDPHNQAACRYRYFGRQKLKEMETDVVGFAQIPEGNLSLANYSDNRGTAPLLFQGLAWIDHSTHAVVRIQTELLAPPPSSTLRRETTRIDFVPARLPVIDTVVDLPNTVVVDVWLAIDQILNLRTRVGTGTHRSVTEGPPTYVQHSRNIHKYSDYKLYLGESRSGPTP